MFCETVCSLPVSDGLGGLRLAYAKDTEGFIGSPKAGDGVATYAPEQQMTRPISKISPRLRSPVTAPGHCSSPRGGFRRDRDRHVISASYELEAEDTVLPCWHRTIGGQARTLSLSGTPE